MLRHLANRASVLVSQLRPDPSLHERYSGGQVQNAFFLTERENLRMTDLACGLINEHYAHVQISLNNERNSDRVKAIKVAMHAFGWTQAPARDLTDDEYIELNTLLGSVAPPYASYQSALTAYQNKVRALVPRGRGPQPIRTEYHDMRLHYIIPEFVAGDASQARVRLWCNLGAEADVAAGDNFAVEEIPEADWAGVWSGLTLALKIRWFEFKACVEEAPTRHRQNTYLYTMIASICKGGNSTAAWCESRMRQMQELHGIVIEKSIMTPPVLRVLFTEFVEKA